MCRTAIHLIEPIERIPIVQSDIWWQLNFGCDAWSVCVLLRAPRVKLAHASACCVFFSSLFFAKFLFIPRRYPTRYDSEQFGSHAMSIGGGWGLRAEGLDKQENYVFHLNKRSSFLRR